MGHTGVGVGPTDGAARVAVPEGWVSVEPSAEARAAGTTQVITVADWDSSLGLRPRMTVRTTPATADHVAVRVLAEARDSLREVLVVSIDPWRLPGSDALGRRLVFAHTDGDTTLSTLVWVVATAAGDVVVSGHAESISLARHDRAFAEAVAGIRLPGEPAAAEQPGSADLAQRVDRASWADVAPTTDGVRRSIVANPEARILVEATVAGTGLRFDATLAGDRATIAATPSPRAPAATSPTDVRTFRIPVTRLALSVAQWLGLGPAWTAAAEPALLPVSVLMNRLVDPATPAPAGVDPTTWRQPWFLWTLRSSATDSGLVMVDTGTSGQCAMMETDDEQTTRFAPLSSYRVWLTLNWLIEESRDE